MAYIHKGSEYVWRNGAGKQPALNRALHIIATQGLRKLNERELKSIGLPIIREVKLRMREIEKAGLESYSRAYRYMKDNNLKVSLAGDDNNAIKHELLEAFNFLHTKTSTVEGTLDYKKWLTRTMDGEVADDEAKIIWKMVHLFEKEKPERFINFNYDEAIKIISKVSRDVNFNSGEIERRVREIFDNYMDEPDIPMEWEDDSPWFRREGFTKEF